MSSRRPLAIALALVMCFAMVLPAVAAPEWTHGITLTAPATAAPFFVNPDKDFTTVNDFHVDQPGAPYSGWYRISWSIDVVGIQVDDVAVNMYLKQKYLPDSGNTMIQTWWTIPAASLQTGTNTFTRWFPINDAVVANGELEDGWYDFKICARDIDPDRPEFCASATNGVLVQDSYPFVDLEKPGAEDWEGATFVTGQAYEMVGIATDDFGIVAVEFDYCDASNDGGCRAKDSPSWIKVADGTPTGVANQYGGSFDSSMVPDDFGFIRMCATNMVGLSNCSVGTPDFEDATRQDAHKVFVNNRFVAHLEPGWNLVSSPLMLYDISIDTVLMHLIDHGTVGKVAAYANGAWEMWVPGGAANTLTDIRDGQAYWVYMIGEDDLTFVGTWKSLGPVAPPEYGVVQGWNLIGYTQWGVPTFFDSKLVGRYLGGLSQAPYLKAMYRYDAEHELFVPTYLYDEMTEGAGYWLALNTSGTINP
jgi:hypothetical protein